MPARPRRLQPYRQSGLHPRPLLARLRRRAYGGRSVSFPRRHPAQVVRILAAAATRIPKGLHRKLKLHCVTAEASVMDFVTKAIGEKLAASSGTNPTKGVKPYGRPSR